jgi:hypothetical protein
MEKINVLPIILHPVSRSGTKQQFNANVQGKQSYIAASFYQTYI